MTLSSAAEPLPITPRTRVGRLPAQQVVDRTALYALLDSQILSHASLVVDGDPLMIPLAFARDGDSVLIHGSSGGGLLRHAAAGSGLGLSVAALDGLVYARNLFDSSMNYRSAVIYGVPRPVPEEEKEQALLVLSEHLMPGRGQEVRPMTRRERAATVILRIPLDEVSMKVRTGPPSESLDDGEDHGVWAGVVPMSIRATAPITSPLTAAETPFPASVLRQCDCATAAVLPAALH
ncbi:pyridoxamine 5'-phosphate oxidase family protein [Cryobacterium sp. PH29-G1]|uniref:pyridoxamine 5'-phosphate oxidase family protein n=1 Tax=Cryobacterium sp. PH29-G1 TaxID=3046211 RepID=UPI0024BB4761|nr:pyridoxamine 5'-phosphate oxidase family protein [Cryobacterium sp. PH29-G1]MDJ0348243.1 pyridoxamine 5'-phosphate oxidase family protein [Cryobacterium sp. PH29-G1]